MNSLGLQPNGNGGFDVIEAELPKTMDLEVSPSIELNGKTYDVMHLQEPTHFQVETAELEIGQFASYNAYRKYKAKLVSLVSGWPIEVVKRMQISQMEDAFNFLAPFIKGGPQTGAI